MKQMKRGLSQPIAGLPCHHGLGCVDVPGRWSDGAGGALGVHFAGLRAGGAVFAFFLLGKRPGLGARRPDTGCTALPVRRSRGPLGPSLRLVCDVCLHIRGLGLSIM